MAKDTLHHIPPPDVKFGPGVSFDDLSDVERSYLDTLRSLVKNLNLGKIISGSAVVVNKIDINVKGNGVESKIVFMLTTMLNPLLSNLGAEFRIAKLKPEAQKNGWRGFEFRVLSQEMYVPLR